MLCGETWLHCVLNVVELIVSFGIFPVLCKWVGLSVFWVVFFSLSVTICTATFNFTGQTRIGDQVTNSDISYKLNVAFYCNFHKADTSPQGNLMCYWLFLIIQKIICTFYLNLMEMKNTNIQVIIFLNSQ